MKQDSYPDISPATARIVCCVVESDAKILDATVNVVHSSLRKVADAMIKAIGTDDYDLAREGVSYLFTHYEEIPKIIAQNAVAAATGVPLTDETAVVDAREGETPAPFIFAMHLAARGLGIVINARVNGRFIRVAGDTSYPELMQYWAGETETFRQTDQP